MRRRMEEQEQDLVREKKLPHEDLKRRMGETKALLKETEVTTTKEGGKGMIVDKRGKLKETGEQKKHVGEAARQQVLKEESHAAELRMMLEQYKGQKRRGRLKV